MASKTNKIKYFKVTFKRNVDGMGPREIQRITVVPRSVGFFVIYSEHKGRPLCCDAHPDTSTHLVFVKNK